MKKIKKKKAVEINKTVFKENMEGEKEEKMKNFEKNSDGQKDDLKLGSRKRQLVKLEKIERKGEKYKLVYNKSNDNLGTLSGCDTWYGSVCLSWVRQSSPPDLRAGEGKHSCWVAEIDTPWLKGASQDFHFGRTKFIAWCLRYLCRGMPMGPWIFVLATILIFGSYPVPHIKTNLWHISAWLSAE